MSPWERAHNFLSNRAVESFWDALWLETWFLFILAILVENSYFGQDGHFATHGHLVEMAILVDMAIVGDMAILVEMAIVECGSIFKCKVFYVRWSIRDVYQVGGAAYLL